MMDILQSLVPIAMYTSLALSIWAFYKREIKSQIWYLLTAILGQLLLANIFGPLGGNIMLWFTSSYLFFVAASFAYPLVTSLIESSQPLGKSLVPSIRPERIEREVVSTDPVLMARQLLLE